jgi:hypothetical protein
MQEFGSSQARKANLLCTDSSCELNETESQLRPVEEVIALAMEHDKLVGHEAVVVRHDDSHPLTSEEGTKAWIATGTLLV